MTRHLPPSDLSLLINMENFQTLQTNDSSLSFDNDDNSIQLVSMASSTSVYASSQDTITSLLSLRKRDEDEQKEDKKDKLIINNPLCWAAARGDLISVRALAFDMDSNDKETTDENHHYYNMTPLVFALINEKDNVFRYLLVEGADPNVTFTKDKITTLIYSARNRVCIVPGRKYDQRKADYFDHVTECLLIHQVNVNAKDANGYTALMWVFLAYNPLVSPDNAKRYIKLLEDYGADRKIRNKKTGESSVDIATRLGLVHLFDL